MSKQEEMCMACKYRYQCPFFLLSQCGPKYKFEPKQDA